MLLTSGNQQSAALHPERHVPRLASPLTPAKHPVQCVQSAGVLLAERHLGGVQRDCLGHAGLARLAVAPAVQQAVCPPDCTHVRGAGLERLGGFVLRLGFELAE